MKKKIRFIINPKSGVSNKENFASQIEKYIDTNLYEHDIVSTERAGHAIELSRDAKEKNYDTVVAVGGDGSVNEVASQLLHSEVNLGIISAGSGNGFAGNLGLKRNDVKQAIEIINNRNVQIIDSCQANDKFYINVAGLGLDGRISYNVKQGSKRGLQMYLKAVLKETFKKKFFHATVTIDDKEYSGEYITIVVANAAMYGYNFVVAPDADLQDGLVDIVMIKKTNVIDYFLNSYRFLNKSIHKSAFVDVYRGQRVSIKSTEEDVYYHVDGEGMSAPETTLFTVIPKSIRILRP
jgi:YegS/Rv2252/BmrU family lipid kinase